MTAATLPRPIKLSDARAWIAELLAWELPAPTPAGACLLCEAPSEDGYTCQRCFERVW